MVFPLWFNGRFLPACWAGTPCFGSIGFGSIGLGNIEQCGGPWQAAARYGRIVT
jgi:hypothetical protein